MCYKKQLIEKGRKIQKQKWKKQNDGLKTKHCNMDTTKNRI